MPHGIWFENEIEFVDMHPVLNGCFETVNRVAHIASWSVTGIVLCCVSTVSDMRKQVSVSSIVHPSPPPPQAI